MHCTTHNSFDYTCDDCHGYTLEPGDIDMQGNTYNQHDEYMATYANDSVTVNLNDTGLGLTNLSLSSRWKSILAEKKH